MAAAEPTEAVRSMSRLTALVSICVVPLLICGCAGNGGASAALGAGKGEGQYHIPKQLRYSFTVSNSTGKLVEKAEFWTPAPVPQTSHQKVSKIGANRPYREERDELGNDVLRFDLGSIPPYGAKIVSVTIDLLMSDRPVSMSAGERARFLSPEPYVESNDERIGALAAQLRSESAEPMARKDYDWVVRNILSENYTPEDRGAVYAIEKRKGDCTEFSYLLTALYRAQQIPARAIGGYVFGGNGVVKAMDYHNWTEFYLNGAWQIADAQKGVFMDKQADYVAMRLIATGGKPGIASQRFGFAGEGLQVTMN